MAQSLTAYREAERAFLASEGVTATEVAVDLPRLGGTVRMLAAGEGPAVLCVPGVMTGGAVFAGLIGRLPEFRCLMIDRPGTGLSPLPKDPPGELEAQERFADDLLVDIADGLELSAVDVISTSMGSWTTFRSAAAHPERFRRICGLGFQVGARIRAAPISMRMPVPKRFLPRSIPASPAMVKAMLKPAGMRRAIENGQFSDEMLEWMSALLRHTPTFRNDSLYGPRPIDWRGPIAEAQHSPELLGRVTAPVHLFWGDDDLFGGEDSAREFATHLPDATVQMVAGAGHAPWLDAPELAAEAVRSHLAHD